MKSVQKSFWALWLVVGLFTVPAMAACPPDEDPVARFEGCRKLAEDGDPVAQRQLGTLYQTGVGVSQSNEIALSWYRAAADQGDVIAFYNLGVMYDGGLGVEQDHAAAAHWYRRAVDRGDAKAMYNLGLLHEYGLATPQDYGAAMRLYEQAADLGEPWAQFALALLYDKGLGVARDPVRAYMWFDIVGDGHEHAAHNRDSIGEELTADQINQALEWARQWRAQRPHLFSARSGGADSTLQTP